MSSVTGDGAAYTARVGAAQLTPGAGDWYVHHRCRCEKVTCWCCVLHRCSVTELGSLRHTLVFHTARVFQNDLWPVSLLFKSILSRLRGCRKLDGAACCTGVGTERDFVREGERPAVLAGSSRAAPRRICSTASQEESCKRAASPQHDQRGWKPLSQVRSDHDKTTSGSDIVFNDWERAANENRKFNGAVFPVPMMSCTVRLNWTVRGDDAFNVAGSPHGTPQEATPKLHDAQPPL